jgi:glycosyltransferase involved in cell wall biosynthesis
MLSNNPIVDITITTYNTEKYIEECVNSVLSQSYKNWKIYFVDDCSTDNTVNKISSLGLDERHFLCVLNKNYGYGKSLKTAIEMGRGELVAVLDSDDYLSRPDALEIMVREHQKYLDASLIYSNYYRLYNGAKHLVKSRALKSNEKYCEKQNIKPKLNISHFKVFKRKYYEMTERLDDTLIKSVDKDLILKLEEVGLLKYIPYDLYIYRVRDDSISNLYKKLPEEEKKKLLKIKKQLFERKKNENIHRQ